MFTGSLHVVCGIHLDEERDELWVYETPAVQIRKFRTAELIQRYNPYQWSNSRYMISNAVSISAHAGVAAISHEGRIRLG
ncbi:hypothetical protein M5W83_28985 [Paenibacillus thiaminolyticus]|uniref:Uncharacterized protein n=1 Tax=Paenibacillus thiaminolyticus TaxID=49283 RepID=A0AAP9DQC1_PANTH|nr:hypothetical protein [Paenibacillus thiaminolyticus]MCY9535849.1 hypothetical protein [Paenibacillus thiaminolyticus]MCY9600658.1 hypothetical protein [Paenibacillus thiaminolyticus]MCY9611186.1 hypothetical protein [Paenibacillus thiaminolyticus]MCY9614736.1 hypothetical protein [Paenibacillus thiaminolyticus]MCY9619972.1 hypothetical protein [Paenibacillus thiaminolyticus]